MARPKKPASYVFVRQQFYEGVARRCLTDAWRNLNRFRESLRATRQFRGRVRSDQSVTNSIVARYVNHDPSTVGKWFRGESPDWANLTTVMMALGAHWGHIDPRPDKSALIRSGWRYALRQVRSRLEGCPLSELDPPTLSDLQTLEDLFRFQEWRFNRRIPIDRDETLVAIARSLKLSTDQLEILDAAWGDAWDACLGALTFWLEQLNEAH